MDDIGVRKAEHFVFFFYCFRFFRCTDEQTINLGEEVPHFDRICSR